MHRGGPIEPKRLRFLASASPAYLRSAMRTAKRLPSWLVLMTVAFGFLACNEVKHYRVLSFFFDGVPRPGEEKKIGYERKPGGIMDAGSDGFTESFAANVKQYVHPPYRDNQCAACHNTRTGQLVSSVSEGLCTGCHRNIPGDVRYVHGPVAVRACLFCHHQHASTYPRMLLTDPKSLCLRCHSEADLSTGPHHAQAFSSACIECHNPHGEDNRFFLNPKEP